MDAAVRKLSWVCGIALFFVMSAVGLWYGVPPAACAWRAMLGAAAMIIAVRLAGQVVLRLLIDAIAHDQWRRQQEKNKHSV